MQTEPSSVLDLRPEYRKMSAQQIDWDTHDVNREIEEKQSATDNPHRPSPSPGDAVPTQVEFTRNEARVLRELARVVINSTNDDSINDTLREATNYARHQAWDYSRVQNEKARQLLVSLSA